MLDEVDLGGITDLEARRIIGVLLNAVETLTTENQVLRAENQRLRDEINRLKGEQGTPTMLPSKRVAADHASERERRAERPARPRVDKRSLLHIDRTEEREVDPALLPPDAERKGYVEFVVQDVVLRTDTVLFRCACWYAASTGRSYQAPLPEGYQEQGHYGPGLKALALQLYYQGQMSEPKVLEVLRSAGIVISAATLATLLIVQPVFAAEYEDIGRAGLASSAAQHIDDTSTRVDGEEEHCYILCASLYTLYRTTPRKDRQAVLDVLRLGAPRAYQLNRYAWAFLAEHRLPVAVLRALGQLPQGVDLDADTFGGAAGGARAAAGATAAPAGPRRGGDWGLPGATGRAGGGDPDLRRRAAIQGRDGGGGLVLGPCRTALQEAHAPLRAPPGAGGGVPGGRLGLLSRAAGVPRGPHGGGTGAPGRGLRHALRPPHGLLAPRRAHRQDRRQERGPLVRAGPSGGPPP